MQRAGCQQVEIGYERAKASNVLDTADEESDASGFFVDDRRAGLAAIVDDDIDPIPAKPSVLELGFNRTGQRRTRLRDRLRQKIVDVLFGIALDRIEICRDIRQVGIIGSDFRHQMANREAADFTTKIANRVAMLALPLRHLPHRSFEFGL